MQHIGILGAMPEEIQEFYQKLGNRSAQTVGGVTFYQGTYAHKQITLCCAGIGKANAAAATQLLITHFGAQAVVFSGIAGNMTSKINIGDVVISQTVCYHDAQDEMIEQSAPFKRLFEADPALVNAARLACEQVGVRYLVGKIATGDQFVGSKALKEKIAAFCQPDCVEMEGAAVAQIAMKNQVPFVIIRAMSDNSDEAVVQMMEADQFDIDEYCATAASICAKMVEILEKTQS